MLFSGTYREKICTDCGHKMAHSSTTAVLFWLMLLGVSCGHVLPTVKSSFDGTWSPWLLTIVGELVLLAIVVSIVCAFSNLVRRIPPTCPECGCRWQRGASGFYDFSFIPTLDDILIAVLFGLAQIPIIQWIGA
jgi:hypothetical protein